MKILKSLFFIFLQIFISFFLLEIVCYFFLIKTENPLYRARKILQFEQNLGWRQKSNLNTQFEGSRVTTNSLGFRTGSNSSEMADAELVTLGPSSAFGWGVEADDTYTAQLGLKYVNTSGIGYGIVQGYKTWNHFVKKKSHPKYILIAFGVNDLDKYRFYDSEPMDDETYFSKTLEVDSLNQLSQISNFFTVAALAIQQSRYTSQCQHLTKTTQRATWNQFEQTLTKLITEIKEEKITPILINTAYFLYKRNADYSRDKIDSAYKQVEELALANNCKSAIEKLTYAKSLEPERVLQDVKLFNNSLQAYAQKNQIKYVDAFSEISEFPDSVTYFYDPVHPSKAGHKKIASQILKAMFE